MHTVTDTAWTPKPSGLSTSDAPTLVGASLGGMTTRSSARSDKHGYDSLIWPQGDGLKWLHLCGGGVSL
jgi:hypothetical protein